jgi:hypothetical protein
MQIGDQTRAVLKCERAGCYSRATRWRVPIDACEERLSNASARARTPAAPQPLARCSERSNPGICGFANKVRAQSSLDSIRASASD